jgi:hypothetical protein
VGRVTGMPGKTTMSSSGISFRCAMRRSYA